MSQIGLDMVNKEQGVRAELAISLVLLNSLLQKLRKF